MPLSPLLGPTHANSLRQINDLGLSDSLVTVPKSHPAAKNRFIYYPDRLTKAPGSLPSAIKAVLTPSSPFYGLLPYILKEPFLSATPTAEREAKNDGYNDESVDSFVSRRLGPQLAGNVLSALVHGIYAGDTRQLSMRAVFPSLWKLEQQHGTIIRGVLASLKKKSPTQEDLQRDAIAMTIPSIVSQMKDASVYSLQGGLEALPKAIIRYLQKQPNVEMRTECGISRLEWADSTRKELQVSMPCHSGHYGRPHSTLRCSYRRHQKQSMQTMWYQRWRQVPSVSSFQTFPTCRTILPLPLES